MRSLSWVWPPVLVSMLNIRPLSLSFILIKSCKSFHHFRSSFRNELTQYCWRMTFSPFLSPCPHSWLLPTSGHRWTCTRCYHSFFAIWIKIVFVNLEEHHWGSERLTLGYVEFSSLPPHPAVFRTNSVNLAKAGACKWKLIGSSPNLHSSGAIYNIFHAVTYWDIQ